MPSLNAPRAYAAKSVALTSSILNISSTVVNFATSDLTAADRAVITPNSSNYGVVAWGSTAPSASLGYLMATGMPPLYINGNPNVQNIYVTSATTLAATISITLEKY